MSDKPHVLIVDDEANIRVSLRTTLTLQGYQVSEAEDRSGGLAKLKARLPDLVLLDLGLPDGDGFGLLETLRAWSDVPVIVISARGQERDKVRALEGGADDYLTKPFGTAELLARIGVSLRHARKSNETAASCFETKGLKIDFASRRIIVDETDVHLTPTEYKLLASLVRQAGKVVTHHQLLQEVWGRRSTEQGHYLRIYMQHLRLKLGDDAVHPRFIETETGIGYRLKYE